jgi:hypothetical protein
LIEHLNVVVSTTIVTPALHKHVLGHQRSRRTIAHGQECVLHIEICYQDWTIHDWCWVISSDEII